MSAPKRSPKMSSSVTTMTWLNDPSASSTPAIQATTIRPPTVPTPSIIHVIDVISAPPAIALRNALQ